MGNDEAKVDHSVEGIIQDAYEQNVKNEMLRERILKEDVGLLHANRIYTLRDWINLSREDKEVFPLKLRSVLNAAGGTSQNT